MKHPDNPIYRSGYERGLLNAPRGEVDELEHYGWARDLWLEGWNDGNDAAETLPKRGMRFFDP